MPINDFDGDTFVAYLDISGFRELMKKEKALEALDKLYGYGYDILKKDYQVYGIFFSDLGLLYTRRINDKKKSLKSLLCVIKEINRRMLESDVMLKTSIAYGHFGYYRKNEFIRISKTATYGWGFVNAYLDNEKADDPKLQTGQCRIVKKNLPSEIENCFLSNNCNQEDKILEFIKDRDGDSDRYYFYWMANSPSEISDFEEQYKSACKLESDLKYDKILKVLKESVRK
jgi:hypothetical protein